MKALLPILILSIAFTANAQQFINFSTGKKTSEKNVYELPQREITRTDLNNFSANFNIQGAKIATKKHDNETYQFIQISGFGKIIKAGHPALPSITEQVLMPKSSKPKIIIAKSKYKELDGFLIHPALGPAKDTYGAEPPKWQKNEQIYNADEWYPANPVSISTIQYRRGYPIALIQFNPVQYNPATGKIRVYESIDYDISFNGDSRSINELETHHSKHFTKLLRNEVLNQNIIPNGKQSRTKSDGKDYIIITHDGLLAAADTLAKWKRQMGYTVEIVSQSAWTSDQVKNAIHSRYDAWSVKPDYFVIIADHGGDYPIPGEIFTAPDNSGNYATDLYYACMDGNSDYRADMAFGRIPAANPEQAMTMVLKTVNYERKPVLNDNYYTDALTCAQFQDVEDNEAADGYASRRFCHTSEDIRNYTLNQGYNVDRIYYTDPNNTPTNYNNGYYSDGQAIPNELLRENGFSWNGDAIHITNGIEEGKFLVFHRDHGFSGGTGWSHPYFSSSNTSTLTNGDLLPVVFSINCHTGEYILGNSFAEAFLRNPNGGAVGVVAAAFYSYSGYNDGFSAGMIDAIWSDPGLTPNFGSGGSNYPPESSANNIRTMGDVLNQGLTRMQQTWGYSSYTHRLFHYFGDPSMRIWTENPNNNAITASHNTTISCDESVFSITNCSAEGAKVTLIQGGELIASGIVSGGNADISYAFTQLNSTATLSITSENQKPYVTTLDLTGNCAFAPIVTTGNSELTDDDLISVQGNIVDNSFGTISNSGIYYSLDQSPSISNPSTLIAESNPTINEGIINIQLDNLLESKRYFYKAFATNEHGTGMGEINHFTTACATVNQFPLIIDFQGGLIPPCWESNVEFGNQTWRFDNPGDHDFQSSTSANGFASFNSEFYGSGGVQNADLISLPMDFSGHGQVSLSFEHYFKSANSGDTATLSYSIDNGETWIEIEQWHTTIGSLTSPDNYNIDITNEVAGEATVKFKWNYKGGSDYYWLIDDIQFAASQYSVPVISNNGINIENNSQLYDYTTVNTGDTKSFEFKLKNPGDLSLNINDITISNSEFTVATQPESIVEAGDSTSFTINYSPLNAGYDSLIFSVNSDATMDNNYTITFFTNLENTYDVNFEVFNSYGNPIENATIEVLGYGTVVTDIAGTASLIGLDVQQALDYTITHNGYEQYTDHFKLTHKNLTLNDELIGNPINITFNVSNGTDPLNNASVTLENGDFANTSSGAASFEVNGMQNITFEISRSGYEDYSGDADLQDIDKSEDVVMTMEGNQVQVNVFSDDTPIENATVTIMDTYSNLTNTNGVAIFEGIPTGYKRSVSVEADNYHPHSTSINILTDVDIDVSLKPIVNCNLTIFIMHNDMPIEGAEIDIDGNYNQSTNNEGKAIFSELPDGSRNVSISKNGFETTEKTIHLVSDSTITYQFSETGISENNQTFNIYPNPTTQGFHIEIPGNANSKLLILNTSGKTVYEKAITNKHEFIDFKLAKGLYFIRIINEDEYFVQKLIIE